MSEHTIWNDESRDDLRDTLRHEILGQVRLANSDRDEILQICREVYIDDVCPEEESESFIQFAVEQLDQTVESLRTEQATWPRETDCDRLDRVEATLRDRGIVLWQVSPCCDSCTVGELYDQIERIDQRYPGFCERVRGYAFFIDQNMADMLAESTRITVYLGYGWLSPDNSDVSPDLYKKNALGIAQEVCDCLRQHDFEPRWDGDFYVKIDISLDWRRRTTSRSTSNG